MTQILSRRPLRMLLWRKDWILSDMKSTLHTTGDCQLRIFNIINSYYVLLYYSELINSRNSGQRHVLHTILNTW